jgi:hypothetical protein
LGQTFAIVLIHGLHTDTILWQLNIFDHETDGGLILRASKQAAQAGYLLSVYGKENMEQKLVTRSILVTIGPERLGGVAIIFKGVGSKESFEEIVKNAKGHV